MQSPDTNGTGPPSRSSSTSRRAFLGALAAGTVATAGCSDGSVQGSGDGEFAGETIRVAPWSGPYADYFEETVAASFEEETGATVEVTPQWSEVVAKVRAAPPDRPPYDVMAASDYELFNAVGDDLLLEIDVGNLSNLDELYPFMQEGWRDEYRAYGPPVDGTPHTIVYDTTAVDFEPTAWDDLMRDEVTDAALDGAFWTEPAGTAAIIADAMPGLQELAHEEHHEAVYETIRTLRDEHLATFTGGGAEFWDKLRQGVVTMGQVYYGSAHATVAQEDDFELALPAQTSGYFDNYVRVRGTEDKGEIIEVFLDHIIDAEVQTSWHEAGMNMMSNRNVEYVSPASEDYPTENEAVETTVGGFLEMAPLEGHVDELSETIRRIVAGE